MNNREFFEQSIFKNNPKDVFRDLGEQVFNQFSSKSFPTNIYNQTNQYVLEAISLKLNLNLNMRH